MVGLGSISRKVNGIWLALEFCHGIRLGHVENCILRHE